MPNDAHPQYALTQSQNLFLRGHQMAPEIPLYNMAWRFDIHGALNPETFHKALDDVFLNNEILRATFSLKGGEPFQQISNKAHKVHPMVDFSQDVDADDAIDGMLRDLTSTPFDLSQSTTRCILIKKADHHWIWFLCQHHIICDAQSHAVLFDAVSNRYQELQQNPTADAPSYPSYFEAAALFAPSDAHDEDVKTPPSTPPYGAPQRRDATSTRIEIPLGDGVASDLIALSKTPAYRLLTADLSILAALLTNYFAFMARITGNETITIGLPVHNRRSLQERMTIGLFVEVLPFTISVSPQDRFSTLHAKIKSELGLFLRDAKPGRVATKDTSKISAVLNFIQARFDSFAGAPVEAQWLHSGAHDAAHALRLHVSDFKGDGAFTLALDINNDVLAMTNDADIALQFQSIIQAFLSENDAPLYHIDLLSNGGAPSVTAQAEERADTQLSIIDLIAAQISRTPEKPALQDKTRIWSYADLGLQIDLIAEHITRNDIAIGSIIAVHTGRSMECLATIIGILKAGCTYVPIAANIPSARANLIIKQSNADAIFVDDESQTHFDCKTLKYPPLSAPKGLEPSQTELSDTAYILFTSGSTGTPKGVAVSHGSLSRYIQWASAEYSNGNPSDYAFFSSISFDLTLTSMFTPLINGGCVLVYPERGETDLAVLDVFEDDRADVVKLTPSHLALVCKTSLKVERIRTLIMGGENLTRRLCQHALEQLSPNLRIANEYGPTEAVVGCMIHWFDPEKDTAASVQIGAAADGMSITIRDDGLNICPIGVTGEIAIAGRLAEGYFDQPEMTEAKFPTDPLNTNQRLYLSGDLGRITKAGAFEYLGRGDQQLKHNGVRLEPAEIEHALRDVPRINGVYVHTYQASKVIPKDEKHCTQCGISENYPNISLSQEGVCSICEEFSAYKARTEAYFLEEQKLASHIRDAARSKTGDYDAIMLLSGGKDSTYAAYRLAESTGNVLALTLDNGFIASGAKDNIGRVVDQLGWDHRYLQTERMNEIFVDSLKTHANVCQGCFKAIYTLALRIAKNEGIPIIVTGLSRGQFYETRLTPDLFRTTAPSCAELDTLVDKARRRYHAEDDAIAKLLNTEDLQDGKVLDDVQFIDIYRYIDVPVSEIYAYLAAKGAWRRPDDTGRSTNCLINDVGIHVHKERMGFHNYALPYSWDVRMGHKTRAQALDELNDEIDVDRVETILDEIGFDEPIRPDQGVTVYVFGSDIVEADIWSALRANLPMEMMPKTLCITPEIPLTPNGKIDEARLPAPMKNSMLEAEITKPATNTEALLHSVLIGVLKIENVSTTADFFDLGIDSLAAIEFAFAANEAGVDMPATAVFDHRNIQSLAQSIESNFGSESIAEEEDEPLLELDDDDMANLLKALN